MAWVLIGGALPGLEALDGRPTSGSDVATLTTGGTRDRSPGTRDIMKALVYHGVRDIRVDDVPEPTIQEPTDAIVRLTASAICGTDLHFVRGTMAGTAPGRILGHEGVGVVEQLGDHVTNLAVGDRVVVGSTVGCGYCSYCRSGSYSQCDNANPNGKTAGTTFFGGPDAAGGLDGMQAEKVRVPYANVGAVRIPEGVSDDDAILVSDIYPTGWFGAENAEISHGDVVAVMGAGVVGLFAALSAKQQGAGRVIVVDRLPDRLALATTVGAETLNFDEVDPVEGLQAMTGGVGPDRIIDAVGVEAEPPAGEAGSPGEVESFAEEGVDASQGGPFQPGQAPGQSLHWAVQAIAKAGTLSIIGVYPPGMSDFPIGEAMNKNLTIKMGNCPHRKYIPLLLEKVRTGEVHPQELISEVDEITDAAHAFEVFDARRPGWLKVELDPQAA